MKIEHVCLIKGCERTAFSRGLCKSCYQQAARLVKDKETTWFILIERGLAMKTRTTKKFVPRSSFMRAFYEIGDNDEEE